jgi:hypothetical protein
MSASVGVERINLTVEQSPLVYIRGELPFCIGKERQIKFFFFGAKIISTDNDRAWWQSEIIGSLNLENIDMRRKKHPTINCQTFVRRSIILSRRILSFLNATLPGPTMPFFWIGVKISLFQKQVSANDPI